MITFAAGLLGVEPPPYVKFEEAELSVMAKSFYSECRYIRNELLKRELGVVLTYPTFRQGLAAQLAEEKAIAAASAGAGAGAGGTGAGTGGAAANAALNVSLATTAASSSSSSRSRSALTVLVVDNGSVRAASTLNLRAVAAALESDQRVPPSTTVCAVSARWSSRVHAADLGGKAAELLPEALRRLGESSKAGSEGGHGTFDVIVLPLFLGPSETVTTFCPAEIRTATAAYPGLNVRLAPPLVCPCPYLARMLPAANRARGPDDRIARLIQQRVDEVVDAKGLKPPTVLLCDHGTPTQSVNAVRELVLGQLRARLGFSAADVKSCSMERREGSEYDFNDPLLEAALLEADVDAGPVVVALMFLQPGKHAGAGGDIAEIIASACAAKPGLKVHTTAVLGLDPLLVDVLVDRLQQAVGISRSAW